MIETVKCMQCDHILGKTLADGRLEIKHRGLLIRTSCCDVVCPRCGTPRLDVGKMIRETLQFCH